MSNKCKKIDKLNIVPNEKISGLDKSFRDIAKELKKYKKILCENSVTRNFLKSPYTQTREEVEYLDRIWTVYANKLVNDLSNLPKGYGKRILFCTNSGEVFIDTSTFIKDNYKWLNYSIISGKLLCNIKTNAESDNNCCDILSSQNISFNPQELSIENLNNTLVKQLISIKAGSTEKPVVNNFNPEKTKPISFDIISNHSTRKEIMMTLLNEYGWASRYSDTIFTPNWYVATQLFGKEGYSVYIRLSYFKF
jgi:hypothetical protein